MPLHIGQIIKQLVENKRLTQKEFGKLINRHEKTVPDIYSRPAISTDLLLTISAALNENLFKFYLEEEPLKSLREDEVAKLLADIQRRDETLEQLKNTITKLEKDLQEKYDTIEILKGYLKAMNELRAVNDPSAENKTGKKDQPGTR